MHVISFGCLIFLEPKSPAYYIWVEWGAKICNMCYALYIWTKNQWKFVILKPTKRTALISPTCAFTCVASLSCFCFDCFNQRSFWVVCPKVNDLSDFNCLCHLSISFVNSTATYSLISSGPMPTHPDGVIESFRAFLTIKQFNSSGPIHCSGCHVSSSRYSVLLRLKTWCSCSP